MKKGSSQARSEHLQRQGGDTGVTVVVAADVGHHGAGGVNALTCLVANKGFNCSMECFWKGWRWPHGGVWWPHGGVPLGQAMYHTTSPLEVPPRSFYSFPGVVGWAQEVPAPTLGVPWVLLADTWILWGQREHLEGSEAQDLPHHGPRDRQGLAEAL